MISRLVTIYEIGLSSSACPKYRTTIGDRSVSSGRTSRKRARGYSVRCSMQSMVSCMEDLPTRQAQAFTLRELEGHEAQAICELLGVTRNNLHVMLHRARLGLRGCLEADWVVD